MPVYTTQNDLLLHNLLKYYNNNDNLAKMLRIIKGETKISLRIVDWFATNYAKQYYTTYAIREESTNVRRFKVYDDYKLKLRAYSKRRFDPFCRWQRISIPYQVDTCIETTIGQLNFFKWTLENHVIEYIDKHYEEIEQDMNLRNSTSKKKDSEKTRKKREELSTLATKSIKMEQVDVVVEFN